MGKKLALFPVLLAFGCLVAGAYGAIHNQISYTVSPDYFHTFKFQQFNIPKIYRNRSGASIVGWYASWWMGLIIGVPVLCVGLVMPDWKTYLTRCLTAFAIVAATALVVGLLALGWARFAITQDTIPSMRSEVLGTARTVAFYRAGTMHDFSYLGGFLGIFTASIYLISERARLSRRLPANDVSTKPVRLALAWGLLVVGPFPVISAYLFASQYVTFLNGTPIGIAALVMSVATGLVGLRLLPYSRKARAISAIFYVPLMALLLFMYGFFLLVQVIGLPT